MWLGVLKTWCAKITGGAKEWSGRQLAGTDAGRLFGAFGTSEVPPLEGEISVTYFYNARWKFKVKRSLVVTKVHINTVVNVCARTHTD